MNSGRVAIRYARGLFKFANERGLAEVFYADSKTLIKILKDSESLSELINNPLINPDKKVGVLKKAIADSINPAFYEFIGIIVRKGRFEYLFNSLLLFRDLYRSEKGIIEVQVESANPLTNKELSTIESLVQTYFNKKTELTVSIKPQLIAGFVLIVEGKIMDYSVTGQLMQFKKSFGLTQSN
jgi:F-type H+-transporting ATPase subunit delta